MLGYISFCIVAVVVIGPVATKNIVSGLHDYSDGFSIGFRKDAAKYKKEQYEK